MSEEVHHPVEHHCGERLPCVHQSAESFNFIGLASKGNDRRKIVEHESRHRHSEQSQKSYIPAVLTQGKPPRQCVQHINHKPDEDHIEQAPTGLVNIGDDLVDAESPHKIAEDGEPENERGYLSLVLQLKYCDVDIFPGILFEIDKKEVQIF